MKKKAGFFENNFPFWFFLVGIPMLIAAVYFLYDNRKFIAESSTTTGVVVDFHTGSARRNRTYAPVVEYKGADGKVRYYYHDVYAQPPQYDLNEAVTVYYNPKNPDEASLGYNWLLIGVFGGLGVVFTGFGLLFRKFL